jgi:hypothetical protein
MNKHVPSEGGMLAVYFLLGFVILAIGLAVVKMVIVPVSTTTIVRIEQAQCLTWQEHSEKLVNWYATDWQIEACDQYSIDIK